MKELALVAHYNVAVENEHLFRKDKAQLHYSEALKLAEEIQEKSFITKLKSVIIKF